MVELNAWLLDAFRLALIVFVFLLFVWFFVDKYNEFKNKKQEEASREYIEKRRIRRKIENSKDDLFHV